jgi:hypothetical protein
LNTGWSIPYLVIAAASLVLAGDEMRSSSVTLAFTMTTNGRSVYTWIPRKEMPQLVFRVKLRSFFTAV